MPRMNAGASLRDPVAFGLEYRRLLPLARRTAFGVLREHAAAEDVAQEVFVALGERPRLFDPRRGSLDVLVRIMARTRALDALRRQASARSAGEDLRSELRLLAAGPDPLEAGARRAPARAPLPARHPGRPPPPRPGR